MSERGSCQHCGGRHAADATICSRTMEQLATPGLIGRQLDRYQVEALLGTGSFSAVYRARHMHTGAPVALKVLKRRLEASGDETVVERFLREARAAATVGSEHIVHVIDAGRSDELTFLALEYLEGSGLDTLLKDGPLALALTIELTTQVLDGLEATHRAGIIHRDMKPANVFVVRRDGRDFVKLLDFGISKIHADDVRALTMTGVAMGTPSYMAPEQFFDARSVDERADLYSVAVMLYELLSGRKPLVSNSYAEAVMKVRSEVPQMLSLAAPTVPKSISDVVMKGLAKAPEDRWQSAAEFRNALRASMDDGTQKTLMRPQAPFEAKTLLDHPPAPPIHPWQAATLIGLPDLVDVPKSPATAAGASGPLKRAEDEHIDPTRGAQANDPRETAPTAKAQTGSTQGPSVQSSAVAKAPADAQASRHETNAPDLASQASVEPDKAPIGSTTVRTGARVPAATRAEAQPSEGAIAKDPTIPPEAAAFLKPVVPHWVWPIVAVVVLGIGAALLFGGGSPPAQPPEAPTSKLREDEVEEPPPPPPPVLKPVAVPPTKHRKK